MDGVLAYEGRVCNVVCEAVRDSEDKLVGWQGSAAPETPFAFRKRRELCGPLGQAFLSAFHGLDQFRGGFQVDGQAGGVGGPPQQQQGGVQQEVGDEGQHREVDAVADVLHREDDASGVAVRVPTLVSCTKALSRRP